MGAGVAINGAGIAVDVTVVPWADYWTKLRTDIAGKSADDIFWVNNSYYADYADNGNLRNIDETLGADASDAWEPSVVDQFTRAGVLWGVPQLSDAGIAVYYNKTLLQDAGIDPSSLENLEWSLDPATDTFLPVLQKLTKDTAGNTADEADQFLQGKMALFQSGCTTSRTSRTAHPSTGASRRSRPVRPARCR